MAETTIRELLYFNGIDGTTGQYDLPPMTPAELSAYILGEKAPDNKDDLEARRDREQGAGLETLGPIDGVDVLDLASSGWGVVFAADTDPAVEEALGDLIALRREQAGEAFRLYSGEQGVRAGEGKSTWLARQGAGPGPANPEKVPYYLLLVGSPVSIPYRFQTQLDVDYAVGRIHFDTVDEYAHYAASVVRAEKGNARANGRRAVFFGAVNGDDQATTLTTRKLVEPLYQASGDVADWTFQGLFGPDASKAALLELMGGPATPALLFSGSHGLRLPLGDANQLRHQGALLCSDWPGPRGWAGSISQDHFLAGDDLTQDADLSGLIAFFYACYAGGTPLTDDFVKQTFNDRPSQIAPVPFLADLPRRMLSRPRGGALAVVSHVERVWNCSYEWPGAGVQTDVFESSLRQLLKGYPVGAAIEFFNSRYAGLSILLSDLLEQAELGVPPSSEDLAFHWTANNDARGYVIIGDPAVRLSMTNDRAPETHDARTMSTIDLRGNSDVDAALEPLPMTETPPPSEANGSKPASGSPPATAAREPDVFSMSPPPGLNLPDDYRRKHPELYAGWMKHVLAAYDYNDQVFRRILDAFLQSHRATLIMYWIVFGVGIASFLVAIVMGITQQNLSLTALFGGLSALSFVTYFIGRPTQSVEQNLQYVTWLGIIYNTYWTQIFWATDPNTASATLEKATADALAQLKELGDHYGKAFLSRPGLGKVNGESGEPSTPPATS